MIWMGGICSEALPRGGPDLPARASTLLSPFDPSSRAKAGTRKVEMSSWSGTEEGHDAWTHQGFDGDLCQGAHFAGGTPLTRFTLEHRHASWAIVLSLLF